MISQFVDSFAVITITHFAANGIPNVDANNPWPTLWIFIASGYVFKLTVAAVDTIPFYIGTAYLKDYLQIDPTKEHNIDEEETRP